MPGLAIAVAGLAALCGEPYVGAKTYELVLLGSAEEAAGTAEAAETFRRALVHVPGTPWLRLSIARAELAERPDDPGALASLAGEEARRLEAEAHLARGDRRRALALLRPLADRPGARTRYAELLRDEGRFSAALAALAGPGPLGVAEGRAIADVLVGLGEPGRAEALLRPRIRLAPLDAGLRITRAEVALARGALETAEAEAEEAVALASDLARPAIAGRALDVRLELAALRLEAPSDATLALARELAGSAPARAVGRLAAYGFAVEARALATELGAAAPVGFDLLGRPGPAPPRTPAALVAAAHRALDRGRLGAAERLLLDALALEPTDAPARAALAEVRARTRTPAAALAELSGEDVEVIAARARLLDRAGRPDEARAELARLAPSDARPLEIELARRSDAAAALALARASLAEAPSADLALLAADLSARLGHPEAARLVALAAHLDVDRAHALRLAGPRARALAAAGRHLEALPSARLAARVDPADAELVGDLAIALGRVAEAKTAYATAVQAYARRTRARAPGASEGLQRVLGKRDRG